MSLQPGDVIRFDYTLWVDDEKKPVDTSLEDVAKEQGIRREKSYRPLTITVGRNQVIPGLEKALLTLSVGKTKTLEISAKDGYGERDPKKIQDLPMAQFRKQKIDPKVGMELNFQGDRGLVTRVAGGRVRIDKNHDLAGKDLRYEITVNEILTKPEEKLKAVLDGLFPGGAKFHIGKDTIDVEVPDQVKFDQNWTMAKFRVITEVRAAAGDDKTLRLIETYPAIPVESHEGHDHGPEGHDHGPEGHDAEEE